MYFSGGLVREPVYLHVSDIVRSLKFLPEVGEIYCTWLKKRTNIIPIIEDVRRRGKYVMLVGIVDVIFLDVAQPYQEGLVCAVKFSPTRSGDLVNLALEAINSRPIIEDARHLGMYMMLVLMVDVIFSDVSQPYQFLVLFFKQYLNMKLEDDNPNPLSRLPWNHVKEITLVLLEAIACQRNREGNIEHMFL